LVGVYWLDPIYQVLFTILVNDGDGVTVVEILNTVVPCGTRLVTYIDTLVSLSALLIDDKISLGEDVAIKFAWLF
jgi:hypothetical protein